MFLILTVSLPLGVWIPVLTTRLPSGDECVRVVLLEYSDLSHVPLWRFPRSIGTVSTRLSEFDRVLILFVFL
jgi:hypothetical protein